MTVTSGVVTITKDESNLIGISIGGGAPLCPCLYIVQVFDNTATARDGTLEAGDEIVGVAGNPVKGKSKVEVAKMIQVSVVSPAWFNIHIFIRHILSSLGIQGYCNGEIQQAARRPEAGKDTGPCT